MNEWKNSFIKRSLSIAQALGTMMQTDAVVGKTGNSGSRVGGGRRGGWGGVSLHFLSSGKGPAPVIILIMLLPPPPPPTLIFLL